jgi:hypothetical protein
MVNLLKLAGAYLLLAAIFCLATHGHFPWGAHALVVH